MCYQDFCEGCSLLLGGWEIGVRGYGWVLWVLVSVMVHSSHAVEIAECVACFWGLAVYGVFQEECEGCVGLAAHQRGHDLSC